MSQKQEEYTPLGEKLKKKKKYLYLDKFESNKTVVEQRLAIMQRAIKGIHIILGVIGILAIGLCIYELVK